LQRLQKANVSSPNQRKHVTHNRDNFLP